MCVLKSQATRLVKDEMCQALSLFQCESIPLEVMISKKPPMQPQTGKPSRAKSAGAKWKRTMKEVYTQFGKADVFWELQGWGVAKNIERTQRGFKLTVSSRYQ